MVSSLVIYWEGQTCNLQGILGKLNLNGNNGILNNQYNLYNFEAYIYLKELINGIYS